MREAIISNIAHWKSCPNFSFVIQLNQTMNMGSLSVLNLVP